MILCVEKNLILNNKLSNNYLETEYIYFFFKSIHRENIFSIIVYEVVRKQNSYLSFYSLALLQIDASSRFFKQREKTVSVENSFSFSFSLDVLKSFAQVEFELGWPVGRAESALLETPRSLSLHHHHHFHLYSCRCRRRLILCRPARPRNLQPDVNDIHPRERCRSSRDVRVTWYFRSTLVMIPNFNLRSLRHENAYNLRREFTRGN